MTTFAATGISTTAAALRRLYFARAAFAVVWAGITFAVADELTAVTTALLVIYPLVDVAAAIIDARASRSSGSPVLRVWGAWAVVAGLVQLFVGVTRRKMGGQWPMIFSGGLSVLAGGSFIAG